MQYDATTAPTEGGPRPTRSSSTKSLSTGLYSSTRDFGDVKDANRGRERRPRANSGPVEKRRSPRDIEHTKAAKRHKKSQSPDTNYKRNSTVGNDKYPDDDPDETDGSEPSNGAALPYACPFFRLDPYDYGRCGGKILTRIPDVVQHLYRFHKLPRTPYCPSCFTAFRTEALRDGHSCHCTTTRPNEFFSDNDIKGIKRALIGTISEVRDRFEGPAPDTTNLSELKWYLVWNMHFSFEHVSPYLGNLIDEAARHLCRTNQQRLQAVIAARDSGLEEIQNAAYHSTRVARPRWYPRRNYFYACNDTAGETIDPILDISPRIGIAKTDAPFANPGTPTGAGWCGDVSIRNIGYQQLDTSNTPSDTGFRPSIINGFPSTAVCCGSAPENVCMYTSSFSGYAGLSSTQAQDWSLSSQLPGSPQPHTPDNYEWTHWY